MLFFGVVIVGGIYILNSRTNTLTWLTNEITAVSNGLLRGTGTKKVG